MFIVCTINDFRNEKMFCSEDIFKKMDLSHWKHDSSQILMDTNLLKSIITQAQNDIKEIYSEENLHFIQPETNSPINTAFKFNRPKRQAQIISNTSLLLQLASSRIVENYIQRYK